MQFARGKGQSLTTARLFVWLLCAPVAWDQSLSVRNEAAERDDSHRATAGQIRISNRAPAPLFKGEQGKQRTELHYDPNSGTVTIKLLVQDSSGYFIPNIRRDNFAVYENGVRQQNSTVEIEHAPVSLALLLEHGGRYQGLNRDLGEEVSRAGHQLLDELGRDDKIAVWKYGDTAEQLADFSRGHETLDSLFYTLKPPEMSEANLYDALIAVAKSMEPVAGRKAIILISSGIDTFSKAKYEDALSAVRKSNTPIYIIGLGPVLRQDAEIHGIRGPVSRPDWKRAERELQEIARISGGRFYAPANTLDLSPTYDDMMENLKVRYIITYKSSTHADSGAPRTVRVALVNPKTGGPLEIVEESGRVIRANVIFQDSYVPLATSGG